jgi:hypothetical protein
MVRKCSLQDDQNQLNRHDLTEQDLKDKIHARLHARCELDPQTDCWVYTGYWRPNGQALIRVGRQSYTLPKVSAWLYIPGFCLTDGRMAVRDSRICQCAACFNPDHILVTPSRASGMELMRRMGWLPRGRRKLSQAKADTLRLDYTAAADRSAFISGQAKTLAVSEGTIRNIVDGISWVKRAA